MSLYAGYAGPALISPIVPASWYINFAIVAFGLYGIGFFLTPEILIKMNFDKGPDKYHIFFARMIGFLMCFVCYIIYSSGDGLAFKYASITSAGIALVGPTVAGFYLEPIQTPAAHMPAHILFLIGGSLGVLATM